MPRTTDRPGRLARAAVRVLAAGGVHRLTHRAVEAEAGLPPGTASNHLSTRAALLVAAAREIRSRHIEQMDRPAGDEGLVGAIVALVDPADEETRTRYLAVAELGLAATREPDLVDILREMRAATLARLASLLGEAGSRASSGQVDVLASLLTGVAFDRMTIGRPVADPTDLVSTLLRQVADLPA